MVSPNTVFAASVYVVTIACLFLICTTYFTEEISRVTLNISHVRMAVATLVRDQASYLPEWIEFHHMLGCDLFLIYDHYSVDNTSDVLAPYIDTGLVVLIDALAAFPVRCIPTGGAHKQARCQVSVFNHALAAVKGKARWMGNFDVDEFIYPVNGSSLVDALDRTYASVDAVRLTEPAFGGNGLEKKATPDADGNILVTKLFTRRVSTSLTSDRFDHCRFQHKTLYNPGKVDKVQIHDVECVACIRVGIPPLADDIRMNHYQFKSKEEQEQKAAMNGNSGLYFDPMVTAIVNEVEDLGIQYLLPALKRNLAQRHATSMAVRPETPPTGTIYLKILLDEINFH